MLLEVIRGGALYVVATPIGHLGELSPRAAHVLASVDIVCAEDTRQASKLATACGFSLRATLSLHDHNERNRTPEIVRRLRDGESAALVSDAGTPGVSDPGYVLVRTCLDAGVLVTPVAGPCAAIAALAASGLAPEPFLFLGFPPKRGDGAAWLASTAPPHTTCAVYVPGRDAQLWVEAIAASWPDAAVVVARELTKVHETFYRGRADTVVVPPNERRGEAVLLFHRLATAVRPEDEVLRKELRELVAKGLSRRDAVTAVAVLREVPRSAVQQLAHGMEPS